MKKLILFGLIGVVSVSSANASWLGSLFGAKEKEPATLSEACNKDELTKICPEVLLGGMTLMECLKSNAGELSDKCATFVKKSAVDKVDAVKTAAVDKVDTATAKATATKDEAAAEKASVESAAKEIKEAATETGNALKATGNSLKSLF